MRRRPRAVDRPVLAARLLAALLVACAVLALDARFGERRVLASLELQTLDWRFRLRGPERPSGSVVLVLADDASVAELGGWPPPRSTLADAVAALAATDARVIVVNLLLAEREAQLPPAARELLAASQAALPPGTDLPARIASLLAEPGDAALAAAITAARRVLLPYAFVEDPAQANVADLPPWIEATAFRVVAEADQDGLGAPLRPRGLIVPAVELGAAAVSLGHGSLLLEPDGSLRADLPAVSYGDRLLPSLALEAARLQLGVAPSRVLVAGARGVRLGELFVPVDGRGLQLLDHYGPEGTLPTYSLADLLAGRIEPQRLSGRTVILGASASGVGDRFATPFSTRLPGSEHLGTAIDNMLSGRFLTRSAPERALDRLLTAVLALAAAVFAGRRSPWMSLAVLLLLLGGLAALLQLAFVLERIWLAALPPAAAILLAGLAVEALRLADERRRRRRLERQRANLARYFAPAVVERLAASDAPAALDRTQEAAVMFVDVVGFTRRSESMAPSAAMALLRDFHTRVERAVFEHGGMVDKFMGDGAMACFGVPDPSPMAAANSVRAALAILADLATQPDATRLQVGIGLHRGPVLMGDIGGATQFQFTVVGDTVNVASRLEAMTRQHGTPLLVSGALFAAAAPELDPATVARFAPLHGLAVRGRDGTLDAWRLAGGQDGRG